MQVVDNIRHIAFAKELTVTKQFWCMPTLLRKTNHELQSNTISRFFEISMVLKYSPKHCFCQGIDKMHLQHL